MLAPGKERLQPRVFGNTERKLRQSPGHSLPSAENRPGFPEFHAT
jgi:hypothetical protein